MASNPHDDAMMLRIKAMKDAGDPTLKLVQAKAILDEVRSLLISSAQYLDHAEPATVFAVGTLSGEIGNLKALIDRDIAKIRTTQTMLDEIEKIIVGREETKP